MSTIYNGSYANGIGSRQTTYSSYKKRQESVQGKEYTANRTEKTVDQNEQVQEEKDGVIVTISNRPYVQDHPLTEEEKLKREEQIKEQEQQDIKKEQDRQNELRRERENEMQENLLEERLEEMKQRKAALWKISKTKRKASGYNATNDMIAVSTAKNSRQVRAVRARLVAKSANMNQNGATEEQVKAAVAKLRRVLDKVDIKLKNLRVEERLEKKRKLAQDLKEKEIEKELRMEIMRRQKNRKFAENKDVMDSADGRGVNSEYKQNGRVDVPDSAELVGAISEAKIEAIASQAAQSVSIAAGGSTGISLGGSAGTSSGTSTVSVDMMV